MDKTLEPIFKCFGNDFYNCMINISSNINEIRIRCDKPVVIYIEGKPYFVKSSSIEPMKNIKYDNTYISVSLMTLKNAFCKLCEYSVYKHQNDINNGFITVNGGHRIGICGTAVTSPSGIKSIVDITSLNIRVARQCIGCADNFFKQIDVSEGVLICGVPSSGKTTLLRDISRTLSLDFRKKVSVIDERSEISSIFNGKYIFDLGLCDIYSGYPKKIAVIQAIRTMSPDFIVCDELTGNDSESVTFTVNYGVKLIASVHCDNLTNALINPSILKLIKTRAFGKIVFLKNRLFGEPDEIYNLEDIKLD